ncbi:MAG: hypothetical protein R3E90_01780 [Marinicella sp.]|nr:hypothetical protein [Xanthomonadales bacterium]
MFVIANKKMSSHAISEAVDQKVSEQRPENLIESIPVENEDATNKDQEGDLYLAYVECGESKEQFLLNVDSIIKNADQDLLESIDQTLARCEIWFDYLSSLDSSESEKLLKKHKDRSDFIVSLASLEQDNNVLGDAIDTLIKNDDPYLSSLSLEYLLRFDFEFREKLAETMNTKDINFLLGNEKLIFLYQCYAGEDCTANGQIMQGLCQIDPVTCNLSYPELVRREVTPNQFDDFILAINSVNTIINSDWFKEREVLNPTDP